MTRINSFSQGGLDFLGAQKDRLGLPKSITSTWTELPSRVNPETQNAVKPASIPGRDQVLAYAAQTNASFAGSFVSHLKRLKAPGVETAVSRASRIARLVWKAYAFLAPGGPEFNPSRSLDSQLGQRFGCRTCLTYLARPDRAFALDEILTRTELNHSEWGRSAKTRMAEALFLERALQTTREIMMPGALR